ncbi:phage major capsid protein, P2 family [Cupriavidus sp. UGS-1]|uniref:phage major capsid protein, P2 family n=1 Tax=Cupriavidus sp. UGS-1 TaxID=2899826 RepID=UPI001E444E44|nr:phage major capsid protein, P2 family [Cupriavidus sp. UGS-1]MCD9124023.1 phage major capsid protein, P2 family [Cupriavidus sp. UGS-1]
MRNDTRQKFSQYVATLRQLNGVGPDVHQFAVAPAVQQKLETRTQESSAFLQSINIIGVDQQAGEKIGLGVGSPVSSTTDTEAKERQTTDPTGLDGVGYLCTQTNFDTHLKYAKLDAWSHFDDFQTRIRDLLVQRRALDRMLIGFNGKTRAANSDRATNPLLQDVNIGWLEKYRQHAAARVLKEGTKSAGKILIGAGGDYANLDALVMDAVAGMIEPWYRRDTKLVAILGDDLLHDKYFPLVNKDQAPTEQLATDLIISQKRVGGKQAVAAAGFPTTSILITRLDNLSIYWQRGSMRRSIIDNPKRDRIENFESSNEAYVVEDFGAGCLIDNIEFVAPAGA